MKSKKNEEEDITTRVKGRCGGRLSLERDHNYGLSVYFYL